VAGEVADAGALDLDDVGTQVRQVPRAQGCGDRLLDADDPQAGERP